MKKKTRTEQRVPMPGTAEPQRRQSSHPSAGEAISRGRSDSLSETSVLELQRTAGNASVSAALRPAAARRAKPRAGQVLSLFESVVPALLPSIPADQINALQDRFDIRAHNADVDRRYARLKKRMDASDDKLDQAWTRKLDALWAERRLEPAGPDEVIVPTMAVLDPAILESAEEDGKAEAAFRQYIVAQLFKTPLVHVEVGNRALSQLERGDDGPATKLDVNLKWGETSLPHTKGKVTFEDLTSKAGSPFAGAYAREVTNNPDVMVLKFVVAELQKTIVDAEVEHKDLQARGDSHPIVKEVADFLGGPSATDYMALMIDVQKHPEKGTLEERRVELEAPEPPLTIWQEPTEELQKVNELLAAHHFKLALDALQRAERSVAIAFGAYERYETRMLKGAGIAVQWLKRAEAAGKMAVGALTGGYGAAVQAGLAGAYAFAQGVAERKEGQTTWQVAKECGVDAALSYVGGKGTGMFEEALKVKFAKELEAYPELAERVIKTSAEAAATFYKVPLEVTIKHIAAGGKMPSSPEDLADMVAKEAFHEIVKGAGGKSMVGKAMANWFIKATEAPEHGKEKAAPGASGGAAE